MAGTMPHAIFVETGIDAGSTVAAYAAELPGCAVFAASDVEATNEMPRRVSRFVDWLRASGEEAPTFVGDNWYEVERAAAANGERAGFSLDDLPPGDEEFSRYLHWLELARELLADRLDAAGELRRRRPWSGSSGRTSRSHPSSVPRRQTSAATRSTASTGRATR